MVAPRCLWLFVGLTGLVRGMSAEEGSGVTEGELVTEVDEDMTDVGLFTSTDDPGPSEVDVGSGDYSDSGDGPSCWTDECWDLDTGHPNTRCVDCTKWTHCSQPTPDKWLEEDLCMDLQCGDSSATLSYDLSKMNEADWMADVTATVTLKNGIIIEDTRPLVQDSFNSSQEELFESFCPGTKYQICLEFNPGGSNSNSFCKDCETAPSPPTDNPGGLVVTGVRDLDLTWDPLEPSCPGTEYQILIDGVLEETTTETQKWMSREPGTFSVAIRASNSAGISEAELVPVVHIVQELVPPVDVQVVYRMEGDVLVATVSWKNAMIFTEVDTTKKGYYLNLYNRPSETSTIRTEAHDKTLGIQDTSCDVKFTDRMDWTIEYSLQTFYGEDSSESTNRSAVFSDQMSLPPPSSWITNYKEEGNRTNALITVRHNTDMNFDGLEFVLSIWGDNGTDLLEEISQNSTEFVIPLRQDYEKNVQISVRTSVGGSSSSESLKVNLQNNISFGYLEGIYILPYVIAVVVLLILILIAILYCICRGTCCRPLDEIDEKKPKNPKSSKTPEQTPLITDNTDNGFDKKVPLSPNQGFDPIIPLKNGNGKQAGTPLTPKPMSEKRRFLFSKSRDSVINMTEPGWMWNKNITSDMF